VKKNKLTDNLFLKIMAVIVAVLVWIIVVNVSDPIIDASYSGVQVEILNADVISDKNQTYEVLNGSNTISVTITAKRSINDLLGKENIKATADMEELDESNGTIRIHLETNKYNDKIESIKSKTDAVEVKIEDLMKKQFSIVPVINGEPVEGYVTGDITLEQNVVTVQGPESIVSQIDHATAEASIAGMSGSISTTSIIRYYNADGEQLSSSRLSGNISAVSIKVELLATKTLPLKFNTTGTPAEGYGLSDELVADTQEVLVAGKASTLANLSSITIPGTAIDLEGRDETFSVKVDLKKYLPDNIQLAESDFDGEVTVKVTISKMETMTIDIPKENIAISGLDETKRKGSIIAPQDVVTVTLEGLPDDLAQIDEADVKGVVTVEKDQEGTYYLPVELELPDGVTVKNSELTVECRIRDIK
jgi:hypothetical protein